MSSAPLEGEQLYTAGHAAAFLGVHVKTLYSWTASRKLPYVRLGPRSIRFRRGDLIQFIEQSTIPAR